jgi:hypothetical protein
MAMLSVPRPTPAPAGVKEPPKIDLSGLPDQLTDPQGYEKALDARVSAAISEKIAHMTAAQQAQEEEKQANAGRLKAIWDEFGEKYEDLAAFPEIIEVAATKVATKAQEKGIDVKRYMFGAGSTFIDDVAKEMNTRYCKLLAAESGGEDDEC